MLKDAEATVSQQRFGIPFMHCGCPLPGDTIGQRLSKLTFRLKSPSFSQTHSPLHSPTNNSTYPLFHSHPFTTTLTPNLSHPSTFLVVSTRRRWRERHARFNTQPQIQGTYLTFLLSVSSYIHTSNIRAGSDCSGPLTYASRIY